MRRAVLGGTFDVIHDGHRAMLATAFQMAGEVIVGITTDERAQSTRDRNVVSIEVRREGLERECETFANIFGADYTIIEIESDYDGAVGTDADYIVTSPEPKVLDRVREINEIREDNGLDRLQIVEAPMVTDYEGQKISATRIRHGEIDEHGNKL